MASSCIFATGGRQVVMSDGLIVFVGVPASAFKNFVCNSSICKFNKLTTILLWMITRLLLTGMVNGALNECLYEQFLGNTCHHCLIGMLSWVNLVLSGVRHVCQVTLLDTPERYGSWLFRAVGTWPGVINVVWSRSCDQICHISSNYTFCNKIEKRDRYKMCLTSRDNAVSLHKYASIKIAGCWSGTEPQQHVISIRLTIVSEMRPGVEWITHSEQQRIIIETCQIPGIKYRYWFHKRSTRVQPGPEYSLTPETLQRISVKVTSHEKSVFIPACGRGSCLSRGLHYSGVTWVLRRIKSSTTRPFVQQLVITQRNMKAPHNPQDSFRVIKWHAYILDNAREY